MITFIYYDLNDSMMKILRIAPLLFLLLPTVISAQKLEMFTYTQHDEGDIAVPKFDMEKATGNEGIAVWTEDKYVHKLFNSIAKSVLSKNKRESLHLSTAVMVAFSRTGEVINCKFLLNRDDRKILTEEEMYKIYMKLKRIRINPYKVRIEPDPKAGGVMPDYAIISGSLISPRGRKMIIGKSE